MNQKKRVENLKSAYQSMDEERREKMELIANGLLNVQMLVDGGKAKMEIRKKSRMDINHTTLSEE
jgi:hypothetical protein